jgi:hypothetical protein
MIRKICVAATAGLIVLITGCAGVGGADWLSRPPLPPSGNYASG